MVAASYNDYLARVAPGHHPKMHNAIDEPYLGPQFAEWSLDSDSTIEMPNHGGAPCKYLLRASFSSLWVIWSANNTSSRGLGEHLPNIPSSRRLHLAPAH